MNEVKFLIIRFSSIGDIVLTSPVVRNLKQQVQNSEIHFLCKKQYFDIVESNPYINKVHTFDNNLDELIDELKNEHFDYIIDLHNNLRSSRIKKSLGIMSFSFDKLNIKKWLFVNFKKDKLPDIHIVDRYMETIKAFDIVNDEKGLDFFIPDNTVNPITDLPNNFQPQFIALVIGATHATKRLPTSKLIDICDKIDVPIVLLGGKEDISVAKEINEKCNNTFNACGLYNLNQSAIFIRESKIVISHDTGLMHIASAFQKKIISVWGNTVPKFGMYPYLPHQDSKIVEVANLKCRPCSKIGYKQCPKKHFKCMNDIDTDFIAKLSMSL